MTEETNNPQDDQSGLSDESTLARLVKQGGVQEQPSEIARARARKAAEAAWQKKVQQHTDPQFGRKIRNAQKKRYAGWVALAASLTLSFWLLISFDRSLAPVSIAEVEQSIGRVDVGDKGIGIHDGSIRREVNRLAAGTSVHTHEGARVALKTAGGNRLRIDENVDLTLVTATRIQLVRGRIYVDSPPGTKEIHISTALGELKELGTQFEVEVKDEHLRVRMREGKVAVSTSRQTVLASAEDGVGDVADIPRVGEIEWSKLDTTDSHWDWYRDIEPFYRIDNARLLDFLQWVARQTGRELILSSPGVEIEAQNSRLHGTVQGMTMDQALKSVLASTNLTESQGEPYQLKLVFADRIPTN